MRFLHPEYAWWLLTALAIVVLLKVVALAHGQAHAGYAVAPHLARRPHRWLVLSAYSDGVRLQLSQDVVCTAPSAANACLRAALLALVRGRADGAGSAVGASRRTRVAPMPCPT